METSSIVFLSFIGILVADIVYNSGAVQKSISRIEKRLDRIESKLEEKH